MNVVRKSLSLSIAVGVFSVGIVAQCTVARAETLWINPVTAINYNEPDLDVTIVNGGTIEVRSTDPGTRQGLHIPYAMPTGIEINSVDLCYSLSDAGSFITQVRLAELRESNVAGVKYDDPTDLTDPGPSCITTMNRFVDPSGYITLSIIMEFEDTNDWIRIGGLGLNFNRPVVDAADGPHPAGLALRQNFPNPFASSTTIEFQVARPGPVELRVYTVSGQLVRTLAAGHREAGIERIVWDGRDETGRSLSPGVYFYRVQVGEELGARTMVLAR
jgi:hypothetical protein